MRPLANYTICTTTLCKFPVQGIKIAEYKMHCHIVILYKLTGQIVYVIIYIKIVFNYQSPLGGIAPKTRNPKSCGGE